eukprot:scaffold23642_cov117-Cylindrotheca_fusiformis.AAC.2
MEVRDSIYCFEIARRSVGRAALHLGVEHMSETALDVMADVLLNYLNRMGRTLSHLAETNGRASSHVNLFDAMRACEMEASPAVQQLHLRDSNQDDPLYSAPSIENTTSLTNANTRDWKGLASFLFGPKWLEDEKDEEQVSNDKSGGKHFPSSTSASKPEQGWQAPYLDEVSHFPQASETCANPHALAPKVGLSLHSFVADDQDDVSPEAASTKLQSIPDDVFASDSAWGSGTTINKRKLTDATDNNAKSEDVVMKDADTGSPSSKKAKANDGSKIPADGNKDGKQQGSKKDGNETIPATEESEAQVGHPHVPLFYPKPPPLKTSIEEETRKVLDIDDIAKQQQQQQQQVGGKAAATADGSHGVRSSLVQLGSYWGSGWDADSAKTKLVVPLGRREQNVETTRPVIPLGRASGSRVSRILEGSLDAAAMQ